MSKTVVYLENNAFLSLFIASIEKFPSTLLPRSERLKNDQRLEGESYGVLFGQRLARNSGAFVYNVTMAVPMQVVRSVDSGSVSISQKHFDRIKNVLTMFPSLTMLGSYHSHPWGTEDFKTQYCTKPSGDDGCGGGDTAVFRSEADLLGFNSVHIILGVAKLAKLQSGVTPSCKKSWISSYFGHWKYKAQAFCFDINDNRLKTVHNFVCPVASGVQNFDLSS